MLSISVSYDTVSFLTISAFFVILNLFQDPFLIFQFLRQRLSWFFLVIALLTYLNCSTYTKTYLNCSTLYTNIFKLYFLVKPLIILCLCLIIKITEWILKQVQNDKKVVS